MPLLVVQSGCSGVPARGPSKSDRLEVSWLILWDVPKIAEVSLKYQLQHRSCLAGSAPCVVRCTIVHHLRRARMMRGPRVCAIDGQQAILAA